MTERLTVALEDGVKAMLVELAGGERKVGAFLSFTIRNLYDGWLLDVDSSKEVYEAVTRAEQIQDRVDAALARIEEVSLDVEKRVSWLHEYMEQHGLSFEEYRDEPGVTEQESTGAKSRPREFTVWPEPEQETQRDSE